MLCVVSMFAVRELAFQLARLEATLVCPLSLLSIVPPRSLKEGLTRASVVFGIVPHAGGYCVRV